MTLKSYHPTDYNTFIGIDVHKNKLTFSVKEKNKLSKPKTIPSEPKNLLNFIHKHHKSSKVLCGYEAGPTGFHLHDILTKNNIDCLVVSPLAIPKKANDRVKNDSCDSRKLSTELSLGSLSSIRIPTGIYRELRHLVKSRQTCKLNLTTTKQRIKSLLLYEYLYPNIKTDSQHWSLNILIKQRN